MFLYLERLESLLIVVVSFIEDVRQTCLQDFTKNKEVTRVRALVGSLLGDLA